MAPYVPGRSPDSSISPSPSAAAPVERLSGHVLIVDDHEVNRRVCRMFCELLGLTYEEAADGAEAVEAVRRARFDLILMDIQMPRLDGLSAMRAIRRLPPPACHAPIVAVTTEASDRQAALYRAAGMTDVVSKPVAASKLVAAIRTAVGRPAEARTWEAAAER